MVVDADPDVEKLDHDQPDAALTSDFGQPNDRRFLKLRDTGRARVRFDETLGGVRPRTPSILIVGMAEDRLRRSDCAQRMPKFLELRRKLGSAARTKFTKLDAA
jgi:hypothetical protein